MDRFVPDHFDVAVYSSGAMTAECTTGAFTYTVQAMGYGTVPMLTIKPMNAATSGIMTYTLKANDTYTCTRYANALVGPYVTNIPLAVSAVGDGEVSAAGILPILNPAGVSLRYGRLYLQNAYGSELLALPVPLTAEHWNGNSWVTNTADSCTALTVHADGSGLALNLADSGATTATLNSPLTSGIASLSLSALGITHTGYVDIIIDSPTWLDFKWDGVNDSNPTSRATFGIYKGNSKFIYIRELY